MGKVASVNPWLTELIEQLLCKVWRLVGEKNFDGLKSGSRDGTSRTKAPVQHGGGGAGIVAPTWRLWFDSSKCLFYTHKMKVKQCCIHLGFLYTRRTMKSRPIKELAMLRHSRALVLAHRPDISHARQYSHSRWFGAEGLSSAAGAKLD